MEKGFAHIPYERAREGTEVRNACGGSENKTSLFYVLSMLLTPAVTLLTRVDC